MEWIKDYWYIILLGLFASIFILGRKSNRGLEGKMDNHQNSVHTKGKNHKSKSGHGCCH